MPPCTCVHPLHRCKPFFSLAEFAVNAEFFAFVGSGRFAEFARGLGLAMLSGHGQLLHFDPALLGMPETRATWVKLADFWASGYPFNSARSHFFR